VVEVHVRDGVRAVQLLTQGTAAKYTAAPSNRGVVVLEPKPTLTSRVAALGVLGNYLLVAEKSEHLVECGPYVAGTLSKRKPPPGDVVLVAHRAALQGPLAKRVRESWEAFRTDREKEDEKLRQERKRAPDFGDPAVVLSDIGGRVESGIAVLADLDQAIVRIDADASGVHTLVEMIPSTGDGAASKMFASFAGGDVEPARALPQDATVGLLLRDREEGREESVARQADRVVALLGDRAKEMDKQRIRDALSSWSNGSGSWLAASLSTTRDGMDLVVRGPATEPVVFDQGVRSVLGLLDVPAVREPLEHHMGKLKVSKVQKVGDGAFLHVDRQRRGQPGEEPQTVAFDVAWKVDGSGYEVRTVRDAKTWLSSREPVRSSRLDDNTMSAKVLGSMGSDTSFLLYLDPQLFLLSMAPPGATMKEQSAPLVLAFGGESKRGWCKVVLSHASVREIVKTFGRREPK